MGVTLTAGPVVVCLNMGWLGSTFYSRVRIDTRLYGSRENLCVTWYSFYHQTCKI